MPQRIVLDTDPGIDDALAILLALASPEIDLAAVTVTAGNCSMEQGARNARAVLALTAQPGLPVCNGVPVPLLRPLFTAPETHGDTGLGYARLAEPAQPPAAEHAVDRIIREIMEHPGEVTLVAVAPLTNVALALRKEPRIAANVREVIIMGGAIHVDGNTTPHAEFNFFVDPHAAQIVLGSGMPITLLPWDITKDVVLEQRHVDQILATGSPVARFIADATRFYIAFHEQCFGISACAINDPVAVALAFMPALAETTPMHIAVEHTSELMMGKSAAGYIGSTDSPPAEHDMLGWDTRRYPHGWAHSQRPAPNAKVVTRLDTARFIDMFVERMIALSRAG